MARIRPVGTGGAQGGRRRHKGHTGHGRQRRGRRPRTSQPAAPRAPAAEPVAVRSAWARGAAQPGVISPLLALDPAALSAGALDDPLALTGSQRGAVHETTSALDAWSRQRDQALNRVARRPGGLTRLAGV